MPLFPFHFDEAQPRSELHQSLVAAPQQSTSLGTIADSLEIFTHLCTLSHWECFSPISVIWKVSLSACSVVELARRRRAHTVSDFGWTFIAEPIFFLVCVVQCDYYDLGAVWAMYRALEFLPNMCNVYHLEQTAHQVYRTEHPQLLPKRARFLQFRRLFHCALPWNLSQRNCFKTAFLTVWGCRGEELLENIYHLGLRPTQHFALPLLGAWSSMRQAFSETAAAVAWFLSYTVSYKL